MYPLTERIYSYLCVFSLCYVQHTSGSLEYFVCFCILFRLFFDNSNSILALHARLALATTIRQIVMINSFNNEGFGYTLSTCRSDIINFV